MITIALGILTAIPGGCRLNSRHSNLMKEANAEQRVRYAEGRMADLAHAQVRVELRIQELTRELEDLERRSREIEVQRESEARLLADELALLRRVEADRKDARQKIAAIEGEMAGLRAMETQHGERAAIEARLVGEIAAKDKAIRSQEARLQEQSKRLAELDAAARQLADLSQKLTEVRKILPAPPAEPVKQK